MQIRALSLNCFHGLDFRNTLTMWPLESFPRLLERRRKLLHNLSAFADECARNDLPSLILLQELNPVAKLAKKLSHHCKMNAEYYRINHGIRLGLVSYPFFLDEGLCIAFSEHFRLLEHKRIPLSGKTWGFPQNESMPLSAHFSEVRGGHAVLLEWEAKRVLVINTHLHHEIPEHGGDKRRIQEINVLLSALDQELKEADLILFGGDLNALHSSPELSVLNDHGFSENQESINTWNSEENHMAHMSTHLYLPDLPKDVILESRQIDHIFVKGEHKKKEYSLRFNRGQEICSDHFALELNLEI